MNKKPNYKDTLNLPQTEMPMKANLPEREPEFLKFWQQQNIYSKLQKSCNQKKKFILHDGPPYANGHIHMGHVLNKTLKDIIVKYNMMQGNCVPFVPGWDCHGLPVEHNLFKELDLTKDDISQAEFRKKAKKYALKFVDIQRDEFKRLGVFADWQNPYLTLSNDYEAAILKSFAKLVEKGYVYRQRKPVNWCPNCQTALAEAEVEYKQHKSPSIYVKFKLRKQDKEILLKRTSSDSLKKADNKEFNFIIWTTTPWTLVSNIAIALNPDLKYNLIEIGSEVWILAEDLSQQLLEKKDITDYNILATVSAKKLIDLKAEHPFIDRVSYTLPAEYVSSEEGTGCVHIAPGHGEEDYQVWLRYKDKKENLGMIMPVDEKGRFNEEAGEFAGMKTDESNKAIINKLHDKNKLVLAEEAYHSYPHCWRCKKPIIFRATWQWFINIDHDNLRDKLKESIKKNVEWIPARGRERILSMIENRPDWCLSRQRYWGVPIPVFYCKKCNQALLNADIIYHLAEMVKKRGLNVWFEKEAKELLPDDIKCPNCQGDDFRKETDILDVWFDSGISHQAVLRTRDNLHFPADLYLEGSDQHRGWFQTSLITSLGIENKSPYRKVLTHGFIIDEKGKKMSKSEGNVISADVVMKDLGADILRLWVASSDYHRDVNLSDTILKRTAEAYRKIRNTLRFALGNLYDFDKNKSLDYEDLFEVDKWALDRIYQLYSDCTKFYKEYNLHKVSHHIYNFCTVDMSSFYLDILKDRLYTQAKHSKARKSAQTVLYELFGMLAKLIAPILSFTAEEAWSYLKNKETESIFLSSFNESKINSWKNEKIRDNWKKLLKVRDIVLKSLEGKRSEKIIGNSLQADVAIFLKDSSLYEFLNLYKDRLSNIFMVSRVTLKKVDKIPVNAVKEEEKNNIAVKVKKTEYAKCPRCWRHVKILGQDKDCPDVCSRCAEAMRENK